MKISAKQYGLALLESLAGKNAKEGEEILSRFFVLLKENRKTFGD